MYFSTVILGTLKYPFDRALMLLLPPTTEKKEKFCGMKLFKQNDIYIIGRLQHNITLSSIFGSTSPFSFLMA